jgi:hypothetical protein
MSLTIELYRVRSGKWSPGFTKLTVVGQGGVLELTREAVDDIVRLHEQALEFERPNAITLPDSEDFPTRIEL